MQINITPPRKYSYFQIRQKTKKYMKGEYNQIKAWNVFEGREKKYYLIIKRGNIQIELVEFDEETLDDIKRYLEYLFDSQYVGISFEGLKKIHLELKNVICFYL